jgi:hypothetical protein
MSYMRDQLLTILSIVGWVAFLVGLEDWSGIFSVMLSADDAAINSVWGPAIWVGIAGAYIVMDFKRLMLSFLTQEETHDRVSG